MRKTMRRWPSSSLSLPTELISLSSLNVAHMYYTECAILHGVRALFFFTKCIFTHSTLGVHSNKKNGIF